MNNKKTLIILGAVVFILIIITVLLITGQFVFLNYDKKNVSVTTATEIGEKVFYPQFFSASKNLYYLGDGGVKFRRYNLETKKREDVFSEEVYGLFSVKFSPDEKKALCFLSTDSGEGYKILNFETKQWLSLDQNIIDADWLSQDKIIASLAGENNGLLKTYNLQLTSEDLAALPFNNPILRLSPDKKWLVLFPEPLGYGNNSLYLFNLAEKKLNTVMKKGYYTNAAWLPNSQAFLANKYDKLSHVIGIAKIDLNGRMKKFSAPVSFDVSSTVWQSDNIFISLDQGVFYQTDLAKKQIRELVLNEPLTYLDFLNWTSQGLFFTSADIPYFINLQ